MTTKRRFAVLALAAAAFTTTALVGIGGAAAGNFAGNEPVVSATAPSAPVAAGLAGRLAPVQVNKIVSGIPGNATVLPWKIPPYRLPPVWPPRGAGHGPVVPPYYGDRDHDHDYGRDHDHGRDHDYDRDHDYYRDRDYYRDHRWYGWRYRPEIVVEGVPGAAEIAAPMPGPRMVAPMAAPRQTMAPQAMPQVGPQMAEAPCNCLTKKNLPDGSVLFQDICTKESAIAPPQSVGAR